MRPRQTPTALLPRLEALDVELADLFDRLQSVEEKLATILRLERVIATLLVLYGAGDAAGVT